MSQNILTPIMRDAKSKTLAQFELKYTGWYLYGNPTVDDEANINYKTDVISDRDLQKLMAQSKHSDTFTTDASENSNEFFVFEIKKKPSNAFSGWISIGRAVNNDIVLRFPTVSKLHARLEIETTPFGDPLGFQLIDNHSTTKTVHNGQYLDPNQTVPICVGDIILFGTVQCMIVDATILWNKLH